MKRVYSDYLNDIIAEIDLVFDFCKEVKNASEFLNDKKNCQGNNQKPRDNRRGSQKTTERNNRQLPRDPLEKHCGNERYTNS